MYKNIIFDMGNVLIMFYPEKTLQKYLSNKHEVDLILDVFYNSTEYRQVDRGVLTYEEVISALADKLPKHLIELLMFLYVENCFGKTQMPVFSQMYELIIDLKANGYKVYLLSNAGVDFYDYAPDIPAISLMDGKIISSDYKLLKPEPEIYSMLFEKYDLNASECIFIDDVWENIDGAKQCGMDGICFNSSLEEVSVLREKLMAHGIAIGDVIHS